MNHCCDGFVGVVGVAAFFVGSALAGAFLDGVAAVAAAFFAGAVEVAGAFAVDVVAATLFTAAAGAAVLGGVEAAPGVCDAMAAEVVATELGAVDDAPAADGQGDALAAAGAAAAGFFLCPKSDLMELTVLAALATVELAVSDAFCPAFEPAALATEAAVPAT